MLDQLIETLSKGYKRRVGIAQAILHDPRVLILDEPTDGLDPNQKHQVRQLIAEMAKDKAIVISTHILEEVEAICTRAVIIDRGRIVADGTAEDLSAACPTITRSPSACASTRPTLPATPSPSCHPSQGDRDARRNIRRHTLVLLHAVARTAQPSATSEIAAGRARQRSCRQMRSSSSAASSTMCSAASRAPTGRRTEPTPDEPAPSLSTRHHRAPCATSGPLQNASSAPTSRRPWRRYVFIVLFVAV